MREFIHYADQAFILYSDRQSTNLLPGSPLLKPLGALVRATPQDAEKELVMQWYECIKIYGKKDGLTPRTVPAVYGHQINQDGPLLGCAGQESILILSLIHSKTELKPQLVATREFQAMASISSTLNFLSMGTEDVMVENPGKVIFNFSRLPNQHSICCNGLHSWLQRGAKKRIVRLIVLRVSPHQQIKQLVRTL